MITKLFKSLMASWMASVGILIILILLGSITVGDELVGIYLFEHMLWVLGLLTVLVFPFVYRKFSRPKPEAK
jgi:hypothetical protein